jgi:hypothetical protein
MLCVNRYRKDYIDECRSRMESQLAAYKPLVATAREKTGTNKSAFKATEFGWCVIQSWKTVA